MFYVMKQLISGIISVFVVKPFGDETYFFKWRFTLLALAACISILLGTVVLVPVVCHRAFNRASVVERMQKSE